MRQHLTNVVRRLKPFNWLDGYGDMRKYYRYLDFF